MQRHTVGLRGCVQGLALHVRSVRDAFSPNNIDCIVQKMYNHK